MRIEEFFCTRKEIVDIHILLTCTDGNRNIMQPFGIKGGPTIWNWNQFSVFRVTSTKVIPTEKTLDWQLFDDQPRSKEPQLK